jgi:hypothetical protein
MDHRTETGLAYCCLGVAMEIGGCPSEPDDDSPAYHFRYQPGASAHATVFTDALPPAGWMNDWLDLGIDFNHSGMIGPGTELDLVLDLPGEFETIQGTPWKEARGCSPRCPLGQHAHPYDDGAISLAGLNDGGFGFGPIADLIDYFGVRVKNQ